MSQTLGAFERVDAIRRTVGVCPFKDQDVHLSPKKHHMRVQRPYITLEDTFKLSPTGPVGTRANFQRPELSHFAGPCRVRIVYTSLYINFCLDRIRPVDLSVNFYPGLSGRWAISSL